MNRTDVLAVACFAIVFAGVLNGPIILLSSYAQSQSDKKFYAVDSNNMMPALRQGEIVAIENQTSFDNLKVGDIIVFNSPGVKEDTGKHETIISRVMQVYNIPQGDRILRTKGDANPHSIYLIDYPILSNNYIGKVVSVTSKEALTQAQVQQIQQQEQDRLFFMTMKLNNPNTSSDGSTTYHVYNITGNLQKFISNPQNETVQYNLNQTNVFTYPDRPVSIWIQGSIIGKDNKSNPDVITQTQKDLLLVSRASEHTKQINTKTNTTTYTEQADLTSCLFCTASFQNIDVRVTIYPNNTGITELKQR